MKTKSKPYRCHICQGEVRLGHGPHMAETAGYKKEDARKMRIKSSNIIEKAIPKLGTKLSEIRT